MINKKLIDITKTHKQSLCWVIQTFISKYYKMNENIVIITTE